MNLPIPPTDLAQLFPWLKAAETILALFLLALKIPSLKASPDWVKATVGIFGGSLIAFGAIFVQTRLTVDQVASVNPYYQAFVGVVTVILTYFGAQQVIVKPIKAWWGYRRDLWTENVEAKRAQIRYLATSPAGRKAEGKFG